MWQTTWFWLRQKFILSYMQLLHTKFSPSSSKLRILTTVSKPAMRTWLSSSLVSSTNSGSIALLVASNLVSKTERIHLFLSRVLKFKQCIIVCIPISHCLYMYIKFICLISTCIIKPPIIKRRKKHVWAISLLIYDFFSDTLWPCESVHFVASKPALWDWLTQVLWLQGLAAYTYTPSLHNLYPDTLTVPLAESPSLSWKYKFFIQTHGKV